MGLGKDDMGNTPKKAVGNWVTGADVVGVTLADGHTVDTEGIVQNDPNPPKSKKKKTAKKSSPKKSSTKKTPQAETEPKAEAEAK